MRTISVLVLSTGKRIDGASLRDQCYRRYFYPPELEAAFAQQEQHFSNLLGDLSPVHLDSLSGEELGAIREFVHMQRARTLATAEELNAGQDAVFHQVFAKDPRVADIDLAKYELRLNAPQMEALRTAVGALPLLLDLNVKFVFNDRPLGFVLSDAPVASYNQWAEHHPEFRGRRGYKGLATKGLQWFYPVSPSVCIAVYDPKTYAYGSAASRICRPSSQDVRRLNALQALHAHNALYFSPGRVSDGHLDDLCGVRAAHPPLRKPILEESAPRRREDGLMSTLVVEGSPDPRLGARFNFVRVIDNDPFTNYDRLVLPVRSEELLALSNKYDEHLDDMARRDQSPGGDTPSQGGEA